MFTDIHPLLFVLDKAWLYFPACIARLCDHEDEFQCMTVRAIKTNINLFAYFSIHFSFSVVRSDNDPYEKVGSPMFKVGGASECCIV